MANELIFFAGFLLFIVFMLALDLGVFNKKDHAVSLKEASIMSSVWILFAIGFYVLLLFWGDKLHNIQDEAHLGLIVKKHFHNIRLIPGDFPASIALYKKNLALEYITGYVVEYALSIDNIFVMVLIFSSFGVPSKYHHRVLVWGIIGAVLLRFLFIFLGASLIAHFQWILYVFGIFLVYTGISMYLERNKEEKIDPTHHPVIRFASRFFSIYPEFVGHQFFFKQNHRTYITPLFLVLLVIEFTDLIFAVDSIPAIFAVTKDPYIVFFSNIFAILGLRSLFFLLVNVIHKFHYLKVGLAFLLVFIGGKMLAHHWLEAWGFTTAHSLYIIVGILALSILASLLFPKKEKTDEI